MTRTTFHRRLLKWLPDTQTSAAGIEHIIITAVFPFSNSTSRTIHRIVIIPKAPLRTETKSVKVSSQRRLPKAPDHNPSNSVCYIDTLPRSISKNKFPSVRKILPLNPRPAIRTLLTHSSLSPSTTANNDDVKKRKTNRLHMCLNEKVECLHTPASPAAKRLSRCWGKRYGRAR